MAKRLKRTADGSVDLRTKAGKKIAERMAKARAARARKTRSQARAKRRNSRRNSLLSDGILEVF